MPVNEAETGARVVVVVGAEVEGGLAELVVGSVAVPGGAEVVDVNVVDGVKVVGGAKPVAGAKVVGGEKVAGGAKPVAEEVVVGVGDAPDGELAEGDEAVGSWAWLGEAPNPGLVVRAREPVPFECTALEADCAAGWDEPGVTVNPPEGANDTATCDCWSVTIEDL